MTSVSRRPPATATGTPSAHPTARAVDPGGRMTASAQPFRLHIPDASIADLRGRLERTRFPDQAPGDPWAYGTGVGYLKQLVEYWRDGFDWRAQEARLNAFPQFTMSLHGIDVHFLHV